MNTDCQHIIFSDEAYNAIMTETFKMNPNETGGILLGHILDNGIWIVMEVLPPGWRSIFQYAYFEYDEQFVNYVAQNESKKYEQELSLLGLWHRHPGSMDTFSSTDDGTNRTFASLYPKGAISGLVNIDPRFRLTMYHVSNPLRYTKVEVAVGDDLIPEEYFRLKYYDEEKGLNPFPPEKKNDKSSTENRCEIGSNANNNQKNSGIMSTVLRFLDSKNIFFLIFLVLLVVSVLLHYSYNKVKDTKDIKSLYKIVYSEYPKQLIPVTDSIKNAAEKEFDTKKAKELYTTLLLDIASFKNDTAKVSKEIEKQKQDFIKNAADKFLANKTDYYQNQSIEEASSKVKTRVIVLWIFTVLSLLVAVLLRYRRFLLPHLVREKDKKFWFQKNQKLYEEEKTQIKQKFPNVEKSEDNGTLSFFVSSDKEIKGEPLALQLVYSDNFPKDREIRVYFVNPDISCLGKVNDAIAEIKTDKTGDKYLKFKKEITGVDVIKRMLKIIDFITVSSNK